MHRQNYILAFISRGAIKHQTQQLLKFLALRCFWRARPAVMPQLTYFNANLVWYLAPIRNSRLLFDLWKLQVWISDKSTSKNSILVDARASIYISLDSSYSYSSIK